MVTRLYTPPTGEPVTLAEAKLHLRVDHSADDALITALITAAREHVERFTRRALFTQVWDGYLCEWPESGVIRLPYPPLQTVGGVYYTLEGEAESQMDAADYTVDAQSMVGRVVLNNYRLWPQGMLARSNPIRVRFTAGYGSSASAVPESIKHAMKLIIGTLYAYRETIITGTTVNEMPLAVESLLWPHRALEF